MIKSAYAADLENVYGFGDLDSLGELGTRIVPFVFSLAIIAVVFYFLIGAFKLLTSSGDKETVNSARNMITHAVIGFILLIVVFLLLKYIPEALGISLNII